MPVEIPIIEVPVGTEPALASLHAVPDRLDDLLASAGRLYTPVGVRIADWLTRRWARRCVTPYGAAVQALDAAMAGRPGAHLLNYSYEWGCTSGAGGDPVEGGNTLLRTLDWPFDGLGRTLIVTQQNGGAGTYASVTWPGYAGVLTGSAPGRFAAAINQPPLRPTGFGKAVDWAATRLRMTNRHAMPPGHLLRVAFDTCADFEAAAALIRTTPICIPAIFVLAGPETGQALVVERTETEAYQPPDATAANHWAATPIPAQPRNLSSPARRSCMAGLLATGAEAGFDWSLGWVAPPILKYDTRLAVMANPRSGRLVVQGWERDGPATERLAVDA